MGKVTLACTLVGRWLASLFAVYFVTLIGLLNLSVYRYTIGA